jgi:hypothetical protein
MTLFNHSNQKQTLEYLGIQPEEIRDAYLKEIQRDIGVGHRGRFVQEIPYSEHSKAITKTRKLTIPQ